MPLISFASPPRPPTGRPRLLMLTHRLPVPPDRGDRIRSFHLLRTLRHRFHVTLACTDDARPGDAALDALRGLVDAACVRAVGTKASKARGAAALLAGRPATPSCFFRRDLAAAVVAEHRTRPFDAVLTFCTGMIGYAGAVLRATPAGAAPPRHVLDLVDVDSSKWAAYAAKASGGAFNPMRWVHAAEARRRRPIEAGERTPFDAVTVVSRLEADEHRRVHGLDDRLRVVGNGVDLDAFAPPASGATPAGVAGRVVFVGRMDYPPNVDAAAWFAREAFPMIRGDRPAATFRVVGRSPARAVRRLAARSGVEVAGGVDSVAGELHRAAVVVAPLRIARGVQNKVLEAMAAARPVVASPQALEGVDADPGREALVAASPAQWADAVVGLLDDAERRAAMGRAARARVERDYRWDAVAAPMAALLAPADGAAARVA